MPVQKVKASDLPSITQVASADLISLSQFISAGSYQSSKIIFNDFSSNITNSISSDILAYSNSTPVPTTIGGIAAGSTFNNVEIQTVLNQLLYPYQPPIFSSFTLTGVSSPLEVGYTLGTSYTFNWVTTNTSNISANSIVIKDITGGSIDMATGLSNTGPTTLTYSTIQKTTVNSHTFRIQGINSQLSTFTRDLTFSWLFRGYYGNSSNSSLTEAQIEALSNNSLISTYTGNYVFTAASGTYKYICFPSAYGTPTDFKDQSTNLNVPMTNLGTVSVTNTYGITTNYSVYRTTNQIGASITIVVT